MANRSTAPGRIALMGLVVAGAVAGMAGTASAQYYYDYGEPYPVYGYGYRYHERYAPRVPSPVAPHMVSRIATRDYGLVRIERSIRRGDTFIVDGVTAGGQRQRLILDAYAGGLIDRIRLRPQPTPSPSVARADPREERTPPRQRLVPQPPERPAALKPPGEASAPATTSPPPPAAPPAPEPAKPTETPAEASAPATVAPPQPARPAEPSPGATNPETGADKPRLVNPNDVRGTEGTDRQPPLATAPPASEAPSLPPVQHVDPTPSTPKPETPIAPVAPLD